MIIDNIGRFKINIKNRVLGESNKRNRTKRYRQFRFIRYVTAGNNLNVAIKVTIVNSNNNRNSLTVIKGKDEKKWKKPSRHSFDEFSLRLRCVPSIDRLYS